MLETLRAYGAGLLAAAGEQDGRGRRAGRVRAAGGRAGRGRAADQHRGGGRGPLAGCRGRHHAPGAGLGHGARSRPSRCGWRSRWRRGGCCAAGWRVSTRCCARPPARAEPGSDGWCAAQFWLGETARYSADLAGALGHFTAVRDAIGDRPPSRALADCLASRSVTLLNLGRIAEAADDGRRALALARELGYPAGEALALTSLGIAAYDADDLGSAVQLARQAEQIPADIPGWIARWCSYILTMVLTDGRGPGRRRAHLRGGAGPVPGRGRPVDPGEPADRGWRSWTCRRAASSDAAAHLREALQIAARTGGGLSCSTAWTAAGTCAPRPGAAPRPSRCGPLSPRSCGTRDSRNAPADARRRHEPLREARQALGPARARAAEERGAAMSLDTAAEYALMLTAPGPQPPAARRAREAQRPGTGAGHPGRPGPHQRPDRRPAVHQRPHGQLAPGPDPGQDRLPPPRRPDPPGPQRGPSLAGPGQPPCRGDSPQSLWVVPPTGTAVPQG